MQTFRFALVPLLCVGATVSGQTVAKPPKMARSPSLHAVALGAVRRVPYTPPDVTPDEKDEDTTTLKVRALTIDGSQREWTTGELHEVTDRSFAIRRVMRLNDALPTDKEARWVWQPGPWLLVDRVTGHVTALHLPDFDAAVSNVVWYRDYAAYCGTATTAKGGLFAIVAELGGRRAVVSKQIGALAAGESLCAGVPAGGVAAAADAGDDQAYGAGGGGDVRCGGDELAGGRGGCAGAGHS